MKPLLFLFFTIISLGAQIPTADDLQKRIAALTEEKADPDLIKIWEKAATRLEEISEFKKNTADFTQKNETSYTPAQLDLPSRPPKNTPYAELLQHQSLLEKQITETTATLSDYSAQLKQVSQRNSDIATAIAADRSELAKLVIPADADTPKELAQQQLALIEQAHLQELSKAHLAEQAFRRSEAEILPQKIANYKTHLTKLNKEEEELATLIAEQRQAQAVSTRDSFDDFSAKFSHIPEIKALIDEVQELNKLRLSEGHLRDLTTKADKYQNSISSIQARILDQEKQATSRIKLLAEAGLDIDTQTGLTLRQQRSRLPSVSELTNTLRKNSRLAGEVQIQLDELRLKQNFSTLVSEDQIPRLLEEHPNLDQTALNQLFKDRRKLITNLIADYDQLSNTLEQANQTSKATIADTKRYTAFLDERLLWIKSAPPITLAEPGQEWQRFLALFSPQKFAQIKHSVTRNFLPKLPLNLLYLALFLFTLIRRRFLYGIISSNAQKATRRNCTSIAPTLKTLLASLALASTIPCVILIAANLIPILLSHHLALYQVAIFVFIGALILNFNREDGLFVAHFKFPAEKAETIFKNTVWFIPVLAPLLFVVAALTFNHFENASGRCFFIASMLPVTYYAHTLLRPQTSLLRGRVKHTILLKATYFGTLLIPVSFAIGAALGFFESVLTVRAQFLATLVIFVLAFITIRFLTRWILVSKRRLAITQALRRREIAVAEREAIENEDLHKLADLPSLEEVKAEAVNVVEVQEQTTQLVRLGTYLAVFFGIWTIWSSTFEALSILDDVTLWGETPTTQTVTTASTDITDAIPEGTPLAVATAPTKKSPLNKIVTASDDRVSLQDLILCIIFLFLTFISARNIPSLLSLTVFSRLKLGLGGNYALTTTARYLIILVGIILALNKIEITWSKVQWLAAAITLGIGFGLKEIFANFVAGIILLFERPIRLGDIVTVGEVSGLVTEIKIRATTIQQFNNRELLVPNKEFITSQLINWTLKDTILRFEIKLGLAYGSDTKLATEVLYQILTDHPHVMEEPKPDIRFMAFGASSLDFSIRGFVSCVDHLGATQSELHYLIDDAFRKHNIEIAFPQQDIHVRSLPQEAVPNHLVHPENPSHS